MSWFHSDSQSSGQGIFGGLAMVRKCLQVRWGWWIQTPPRWWSSHFHSWLGLCFHHLDQLSQVCQGLTCFLSASWEPPWRVGSIPSVGFLFNDHSCEFFGSFPLPLLHIICARYHTFIPECPSGFSICRAQWSSVTSHMSSLPDVFLRAVVTLSLSLWETETCPGSVYVLYISDTNSLKTDNISVFTLYFFMHSQYQL